MNTLLFCLFLINDPQITILDRQISQENFNTKERIGNSGWKIIYKLKYCGKEPIELSTTDINFEYKASVSNSSVPSHIRPIKISAEWLLAESNQKSIPVISHSNDRYKCKEIIKIAFSTGLKKETEPFKGTLYFIPLKLIPEQEFWCYLTLEHEHFLYGNYNLLLGEREIKIKISNFYFLDKILLEEEYFPIRSKIGLNKIPDERLDTRQFHSAPGSLLLAADIVGCQYFSFDDLHVKYGNQLKLSFYYLIACDTEGECRARIMEYQDTPNAWYRLEGAGFDELLIEQGRWKKFEKDFQVNKDTTTLAIDFRIIEANIGEMWIDDVVIDYVEKAPQDK